MTNYRGKLGIHVNVHMSKIVCTLIKVGTLIYAMHTNCRTLNVVFCWYSNLMSHTHKYTHTHTHKHTQHTLAPLDWCTHMNIIYTTCYVLTAAIFITMNEYITDIKNLLSTMSFLFKNDSLVKVRLGSSCETQIILIEMV